MGRASRFGAGLVLALALTGCTAAAPDRAASRLDEVVERGELRVCSTGDYRPFTYRDESGAWRGIDIDMARDLASRLGVRAEIVPTTWGDLLEDFQDRCDIAVGGVSITLERARHAAFSEPYLAGGKAPITRCGEVERFATLERIDQPGVRVVVNPGGTNEEFTRGALDRATVIGHPDNNTIFQEIAEGRADLMITDAAEARWQATRDPRLCAVHPDRPFTFSEKAYLLPRGDVAFRHYVDQWLNLALHDGTYQRISRPWLGAG
ncbi:transporter substrate-binding domain-containing protein [Saccharopolyspora sp. CA-218241]|uniref:transporter substrate-binding domain-containing protein n=1 Tax=Saccharopolyspora sp. CA-218241 TaxID=3240027 RepID=UPI003D96BB83